MAEESVHLWQDHSDRYLEMAFRADRRGRIAHPDGYGRHTGECGDTIEIFLSVHTGCIESVMFELDGCINTNACANTLACLVEGRTVAQAWQIRPETIIDHLRTLPADHHHCAELVAGAFYRALADHNEMLRRPWKKAYRER